MSESVIAKPTNIRQRPRVVISVPGIAQADTFSRADLVAAVELLTTKYQDQPVPRPPYWSGYRLVPDNIEFWKEQPDRLHERELYTREKSGWTSTLLAP